MEKLLIQFGALNTNRNTNTMNKNKSNSNILNVINIIRTELESELIDGKKIHLSDIEEYNMKQYNYGDSDEFGIESWSEYAFYLTYSL